VTDRQISKSTNQYTWKIFDFASNKQINKQTESGENITSFTFGGRGNEWRWRVILDLVRFTRRGLMVDRVNSAQTWGRHPSSFRQAGCSFFLLFRPWQKTLFKRRSMERAEGARPERMRSKTETTDVDVMVKWKTHRFSFIVRDFNNLTSIGFHSIKVSKPWGRGASPEGRAVLHQAVNESLVGGSEFRSPRNDFAWRMQSQQLALEAKCGLLKKDDRWKWDTGVWMTELPQEDY